MKQQQQQQQQHDGLTSKERNALAERASNRLPSQESLKKFQQIHEHKSSNSDS